MKHFFQIIFIALFFLTISCTTKKSQDQLNYLQNIEQIGEGIAVKNQGQTVQPGDQLMILFTAKDNDVVRPFNQTYSSSENIQNPILAGNTPQAGMTTISGPTYIVDSNGDIDINVLGKINTTGKNIVELKEDLQNRMTSYVKNPTVNIRHANFRITVLGEVNRPSEYTIADGQTTILKAIGLAGELTIFGKRDNVLVIRNENGTITKGRVDLTDANFMASPYYFLKQGDVVIISANENKLITSRTNPNTALYVSIASATITAIAVLYGIFKK